MKLKHLLLLAFLLSTINSQLSTLHAQGTAFTYQGKLNDGANPATGTYDLRFTIYDTNTVPGVVVGNPITNTATGVTNGLFTVTLDFGPGVFTGPDRWLEIGVRTNAGGAFASLSPRQKLTPTPYAITAANVTGNVSASQLSGSIAPANIGAGTITSTMLAAGSVTTANLANGAVTLGKLNTTSAWIFARAFLNPTPGIGDTFGANLAALGNDKVLISAQWHSSGGLDGTGAAYLFGADGALLTSFTNPAPAAVDLFGLSIAAVGSNKVLIGAAYKDTGATDAGAAFLFSTNGTLLCTFTNPSPEFNEEFGNALTAVGPDKVLIGAPYDNLGATNAGAAYLFSTNGTLLRTFANPTPAVGDQFGHAVEAVGPDKVLISAVADDTGATNTGAAYLFSTNGTLLTTFTNPAPAELDLFGYSIAAVGTDKVLISAVLGSAGVTNSGVVYLYSTSGTRLVTFVSPTPTTGEVFGYKVAWMSPDKVLIGAIGHNSAAGAAYLFNTNGTLLATLTKPNATNDDYFGCAVLGIGTDKIMIGAYGDDIGATDTGAAYLFTLSAPFVPGLISQGVVDGSITAASLGNLAIDSSKIVDGTIIAADLADGAVTDAKIANIDAAKITTGTLADARLSANVALLNGNQTFTGQNILNNAANVFFGDGGPLVNVNALTLGGISANGFWRTTGNSGTTPGPNFLGTTDNSPLEIRVNGARALRIEPGGSPSLVGGYFQNSVAGFYGAAVCGGGTSGSPNGVSGNYAFVGAGHGANAGEFSAVVAGAYNNSPAQFGFIGTGLSNTNLADFSFIGSGSNNFISVAASRSFIGGGSLNTNLADSAAIGGGSHNVASGFAAAVSGGFNNLAANNTAAVAGGAYNQALGQNAFIGGGSSNTATALNSAILGGFQNVINAGADHSTISGGYENLILNNSTFSTIGGGVLNISSDSYATIGGGGGNRNSGFAGTIGGGYLNTNTVYAGTVSGGEQNISSGFAATVSGGRFNTGGGVYAVVPGGYFNSATGSGSFAAGSQARANHQGSFVWADSQLADFASTTNNQFNVRAAGGVRLSDNTPNLSFGATTRQMFNLYGAVYGIGVQSYRLYFRTDAGAGFAWFMAGTHNDATDNPGAGGTELMRLDNLGNLSVHGIVATNVSLTSDRSVKENFKTIDARAVLQKVAGLPLSEWNFKSDSGVRHIGPMAQDFYAAFNVGFDDKHIAVVDEGGVALAAIQGLNQKVEEQHAELKQKQTEITELRQENDSLEKRLNALETIIRNQKPN